MQHLLRTWIHQHSTGKRELGKKKKRQPRLTHKAEIQEHCLQRINVKKILVLAQLTVSTMRSVEVQCSLLLSQSN